MSAYLYSVVLICPLELRDKGNLLACALGHDTLPGRTFSSPLSADGSEPATHYGCRAVAQQSFVDLFAGAAQGLLPSIAWADFGLTSDDVVTLLGAMTFDTRPLGQSDGHYVAALRKGGLQVVPAVEAG